MKKYMVLEDTNYFKKDDIVFERCNKVQEIEVMDKEIYPSKIEIVHWNILKLMQ
ncbi:hypothetical protein AXJ14_gp160 [Geobacillus virus E3]|uniref:hypothetical protein n=1 Tax=Geobacillus virus E3 TaxID=1572712 RepID=UPI000671A6EB|nr:hypothetical protein AXJ14_gp160 [Geobacillus virus E3]AJA41479.1 hypothetical protein E3_0160 [Geobacillus virus E3]